MSDAVTNQTFDTEVIQSETPVIVDFWAEWCGPCHAVSPVLDRIAEEREGELRVVKVNIDEEQELAIRYGVASIPTMILFKDGEPTAAAIGAQPKGAIERSLGLARDRLRVVALTEHVRPDAAPLRLRDELIRVGRARAGPGIHDEQARHPSRVVGPAGAKMSRSAHGLSVPSSRSFRA